MAVVVLYLLALVAVYVSLQDRCNINEQIRNECSVRVEIILGRMLTLENGVAELQRQVADLKRNNKELSEEIYSQKVDIKECKGNRNQHKGQYEDINSTVQELTSELVTVREKNAELNSTVVGLENQVRWVNEELNNNVKYIKMELMKFEMHTLELGDNVTTLQNELDRISWDNSEINGTVQDLKLGFGKLGEMNAELNTTVRMYEDKVLPPVGFKARCSSHVILGIKEILIFDDVLENTHDAYNPITGLFVAPYDGKYLFSATVMSQLGKTVRVNIVKNGKMEIGRLFTGNGPKAKSGSVTAATNLQKGDEICVKGIIKTGYVYGYYWSNFSGVLLTPY